MKASTLTVLLGLSLAGCQSEPEHSVEWYIAHPKEAEAKARACAAMPEAKAALDGNCARAREANGTPKPVKVEFDDVTGGHHGK